MGARRERNHDIPRFLLNRFASRSDPGGKKYWIWRLSKDKEPIELSTKDAAVSTRFYGEPNNGLEDALATAEGVFGQAVKAIDSGAEPTAHAEALRKFVWIQAVRRALRTQATSAFDQLFAEVVSWTKTPDGAEEIKKRALERLPRMIEEELVKLPPLQRAAAAHALRNPQMQAEIHRRAHTALGPTQLGFVMGLFESMIRGPGKMEEMAKKGHIKGLSGLLAENRLPKMFKPAHWHVLRDPTEAVILGDACVVVSRTDGSCGHLLGSIERWEEAYVAISKRTILVASRTESHPSLSPREVNRVSAQTATHCFFASNVTAEIRSLVPLIGTESHLISETEIRDVVRSSG